MFKTQRQLLIKNKTAYIKNTPYHLNKSDVAELVSLCTVLFHLGPIPCRDPHGTFLFKSTFINAYKDVCLKVRVPHPQCTVLLLTAC